MVYGRTKSETVTISSGGTVSTAAEADNMLLSGILLPTMTGATITFQWSIDNTTFVEVVETDGSATSYTATDGDVVRVDPSGWAFAGQGWIKVVSASAEAADRDIVLLFRTSS